MAVGVGSGYRSSGGHRVFVLVDNDSAKGVFFSWDAAADFADVHDYSLENLMEYETPSDHPDHLHLMAAKWDDGWKFQGEWSYKTAKWQTPPTQVRLDHYHAKGDEFQLFRSREFDWQPSLLAKINPMAPDVAFDATSPRPARKIEEPAADTPRETPVEEPASEEKSSYSQEYEADIDEADIDEDKPEPESPQSKRTSYFKDYETDFESDEPEISFDDADAMMSDKIDTSPSFPSPVRKLPKIVQQADNLKDVLGTRGLPPREESVEKEETQPEPIIEQPPKVKPKLRLTPTPLPIEEKPDPNPRISPEKSRIIKKSNLKLKKKAAPEPIPAFMATSTHGTHVEGKPAGQKDVSNQDKSVEDIKPTKVWSPKLIVTVAAVAVSWTVGLLWALIPEPSVESIVAEIATLNRARMVIVEPKMVYYQFEVDPVHQERYIQNLGLLPIPRDEPISFPTYHTMTTWEKPGVYIRPPYGEIEVEEWWDLKKRDIQYGCYRQWSDGSILILDFESDSILGWAQPKQLKEILN